MREYYRLLPDKRRPHTARTPTTRNLIAARIGIDTRGADKHLLCNWAGRT